jgi:hypothetical protein
LFWFNNTLSAVRIFVNARHGIEGVKHALCFPVVFLRNQATCRAAKIIFSPTRDRRTLHSFGRATLQMHAWAVDSQQVLGALMEKAFDKTASVWKIWHETSAQNTVCFRNASGSGQNGADYPAVAAVRAAGGS